LDPIVRYGGFGVDVFFVLSGFIITHVYADTFSTRVTLASYGSFLQNRIARLYPVHIATLGLMIAMYVASRDLYDFVPRRAEAYSPASIVANLTMTHAWFAGVWAPNTPAWSISAEWFAYLAFPLAALLLVRAPAWLQVAIIPLALVVMGCATPLHPLVRISTEFAIGMGVYLLHRRVHGNVSIPRAATRYAGVVALGVTVASLYVFAHPRYWIVALCAAVLIASLATEADLLGSALASSPLVYLGEISYSIYMCQWMVWSMWRRGLPRLLHHHIPDLVLMGTAAGAIVGISALAYHCIEVPGRSWIRKALARRRESDRRGLTAKRAGASTR
jgi:peptidoglycan/LPS O-acetylase OafA/YrhL